MKTTTYIPDELVDGIRESAWKERKSVRQYLGDLHNAQKA